MIVAGIDIGSSSTKAVTLCDGQVLGWEIVRTGPDSEQSAASVMAILLERLGLALGDLAYTVATGYGRVNVSFAQRTITEISCHAKGAHWLVPDTRTILDIGGQDCKAIRCNEQGKVVQFLMNDKCAAGTGRYFERIAAAVGMSIVEIGAVSLSARTAAAVTSQCAIFAEVEIIGLLRKGVPIPDILAGATAAMAGRICHLLERVGLENALLVSGGVGKNVGVVSQVQRRLGVQALQVPEPQIIGALGAALFAAEKAAK